MLYELRFYQAATGKMDALHARFRDHTVPLFERHGIEVVGFWVPEHDQGQLVYLLRFPDREAMQRAWDGFKNDPEWQATKAESEQDGPLVTKQDSWVMQPTEYSSPLG